MKRLISALVALILCMSMVCVAEEKATIVATTFPLYDIAKNVGGDLVNVVYVPDYQENSIECDVIYVLSEESAPWAKELKNVRVEVALKGIELIEGDNYAFTAPINVMIASSYLMDALCEIDPAHTDVYLLNYIAYFEQINEIDAKFREADIEDKSITCNDGSMAYFAKEYGIQIQDGEEACVLSTYNFPSEEDVLLSYAELMLKNLEALLAK